MILTPSPFLVGPTARPLFHTCEGAVDEAFFDVDLPSVQQVHGQLMEHLVPDTGLAPRWKVTMTGLVGRIARRQVQPGSGLFDTPTVSR